MERKVDKRDPLVIFPGGTEPVVEGFLVSTVALVGGIEAVKTGLIVEACQLGQGGALCLFPAWIHLVRHYFGQEQGEEIIEKCGEE